jgi:hypothetical protein
MKSAMQVYGCNYSIINDVALLVKLSVPVSNISVLPELGTTSVFRDTSM